MKLTGAQLREAAEIADGADVKLTRQKGEGEVFIDLHRLEDGLQVRIHENGRTSVKQAPPDRDRSKE